jgi:hypothetical protein
VTSRVIPAASVAILLALTAAVAGQSQTFARVIRNGNEAVLSVLDPRPLDAAAVLLAREFGLQINVEDPLYFGRDDVEDVTGGPSPKADARKPTLAVAGTVLERRFEVDVAGWPRDVRQLLKDAVGDANAQAPFAYRIDSAGEMFSLVATRTRDGQGRSIHFTPILDRHVTIPRASRRVDQHLAILTKLLEAETGVRVGCCSSDGPWGSAVVTYGGTEEPARNALVRLLHAEASKQQTAEADPVRYQWLLRCQTRELWCFINIVRVQRKD